MKVNIVINSVIICILSALIFQPAKIVDNENTSVQRAKDRVCLIIVDGLRYDTVEHMKFLSSITNTNEGILYKALCGTPSLSRPGYERILTGTETSVNLTDRNDKIIPSSIPSLFYSAKSYNLKTAFSGFYWINQLYPYQIDYEYYYYFWDVSVFKKSKHIINKYTPDFIVIHPMMLDYAGHRFGGASKKYINTSKIIDKNIEDIWEHISVKGYALMVVSDHGHMDTGGHGGDDIKCLEIPVALISKNLSHFKLSSSEDLKKQTDIAPTICDILGIPKAEYMSGNSIISLSEGTDGSINAFSDKGSGDLNIFLKVISTAINLTFSAHSIFFMFSIFFILNFSKKKLYGSFT